MQSIHLKEVDSTQTYLKQNYSDLKENILVSTSHQKGGHGRRGTHWEHLDEALAFSFTIKPSEVLTLSPLEIGCLLADFFSPELLLKWPNDLINKKQEKVGGIICQLVGETIVVGVGINIYVNPTQIFNFPYPIGGLFEQKPNLDTEFKSILPNKLYQHVLNNRLTINQIKSQFNQYCAHLNQEVKITDHQKEFTGRFIGISDHGEALLEKEGHITKVLTGSLRLN